MEIEIAIAFEFEFECDVGFKLLDRRKGLLLVPRGLLLFHALGFSWGIRILYRVSTRLFTWYEHCFKELSAQADFLTYKQIY